MSLASKRYRVYIYERKVRCADTIIRADNKQDAEILALEDVPNLYFEDDNIKYEAVAVKKED